MATELCQQGLAKWTICLHRQKPSVLLIHAGQITPGASGALTSTPVRNLPASAAFSTRGDHVALCAPGERIRSLGLDGYQQVTGTSFAAPFVAGAAALLVARAESRSTPIDAALVRELLVESATSFSGGPVAGCGAGVLNAAAELNALDAWIDRTLPDDTGRVEDG